MFNFYQNNLTSPLCSLFTRNCEFHGHYTGRRNDTDVVAHSTHLMTKNFIYQGPDIKEMKFVSSFNRQLKRIYIK